MLSAPANLTTMEPAVSLSISRMDTNVLIAWPQTCLTYTLERTDALTPPVSSWSPVGVAPSAGGGYWRVTIPATGTNYFFRLRNP